MTNIQAYWARHRAKCAELTIDFPCGFLKLTPQDRPDLNVTESDPIEVEIANAARLLIQGGYQISTPEEIETGNEHEQQRKRVSEAQEFGRDKKLCLVIDARPPAKGKK
jgi:hypothetical protein